MLEAAGGGPRIPTRPNDDRDELFLFLSVDLLPMLAVHLALLAVLRSLLFVLPVPHVVCLRLVLLLVLHQREARPALGRTCKVPAGAPETSERAGASSRESSNRSSRDASASSLLPPC
ncbi:unnamed protein product [Prorocentrum cordatum]|nr:unnamed protein product [Polarella glacialis]